MVLRFLLLSYRQVVMVLGCWEGVRLVDGPAQMRAVLDLPYQPQHKLTTLQTTRPMVAHIQQQAAAEVFPTIFQQIRRMLAFFGFLLQYRGLSMVVHLSTLAMLLSYMVHSSLMELEEPTTW